MPRQKKTLPSSSSVYADATEKIERTIQDMTALVDRMVGDVRTGDCRGALDHHLAVQKLLRAAARQLVRASSVDEQLRRAPKKTGVSMEAVCPTGREECKYAIGGGECTISAALSVSGSGGSIGAERVPARYCLVEVAQLVTSHQPLRGFAPDPKFPAGAQERDYRQPSERAKVEAIANGFDAALVFNTSPEALGGPPVANEDGIVLGGNGRTMALRLVYGGGAAVAPGVPRHYLVEHAHEFGLDPAAVERFAAPILVRTIRAGSDVKVLAAWSRRLNTALSQQLDSTRLAVSRARFVDDAVLNELSSMGEDETLVAFLSSGRSRGFVGALQRHNVIDGRAAPLYLGPKGLLSDAGRTLVAELLTAILLPDAELLGLYGRGPVAALARAAPALVQLRGTEYDLAPALAKAVRDRVTMRQQEFARVADYLRQQALLGGSGPLVAGDRLATPLLYILEALEDAPAKLTRLARRYVELAKPGAAGQSALFASEQLTPIDALRRAAKESGVALP
jgi:hypothetical protein